MEKLAPKAEATKTPGTSEVKTQLFTLAQKNQAKAQSINCLMLSLMIVTLTQ